MTNREVDNIDEKPRIIGVAFFEAETTMAEKLADKYKISPNINDKVLVMQVLKRGDTND